MRITEAKLDRMQKLSDETGVIKAVAMDQRGSLVSRLSSVCGIEKEGLTNEMIEEFKEAVSQILTPYASAILLDPEWGLPGAKARAEGTGLILSYEKSGVSREYTEAYSHSLPARIKELIPHWSVRRSIENEADAVKLLVYYHPDEKDLYNDQKEAMVERVGAECAYHDIPLLLELLGYGPDGGDWKNDPELAREKPYAVRRSIVEFSRDKYNVDILKVEVPVNLKFTKGTGTYDGRMSVYDREEVLEHFAESSKAAKKPMIYLSAGVDALQMRESLRLANESGADWHGVLCGRATWQDGIAKYAEGGIEAFQEWLKEGGADNITKMNSIINQGAKPWYEAYGGRDEIETIR